MLKDGEFDIDIRSDGIEVWVTQMGDFMNMNTAIIDRTNKVVVIIDPFDSERWFNVLKNEDLCPTHLLYTHTHRVYHYTHHNMKLCHQQIQTIMYIPFKGVIKTNINQSKSM